MLECNLVVEELLSIHKALCLRPSTHTETQNTYIHTRKGEIGNLIFIIFQIALCVLVNARSPSGILLPAPDENPVKQGQKAPWTSQRMELDH